MSCNGLSCSIEMHDRHSITLHPYRRLIDTYEKSYFALIIMLILSSNAFAGGSVSGKIRAINTDSRPVQ